MFMWYSLDLRSLVPSLFLVLRDCRSWEGAALSQRQVSIEKLGVFADGRVADLLDVLDNLDGRVG